MSRAEHQKVGEQSHKDARDVSRITFVTGFPILIILATLLNLFMNGRIGWGALPGGTYMGWVMIGMAAILFRFAAVLGYRSLRRGECMTAFFSLGLVTAVANLALIRGPLSFSSVHGQSEVSTWMLLTLMPVSILLGLMIDLKHPMPTLPQQPGKMAAQLVAAGGMVLATVCTWLSFLALEYGAGGAMALLTVICGHAVVVKLRRDRHRTGVNSAVISPAAAEESSQP